MKERIVGVMLTVLFVVAFMSQASAAPADRVLGNSSEIRFTNIPVSGPLVPGQERPEIVYDRTARTGLNYIYVYSDGLPSWTQIYPCDEDFGTVFVNENYHFRAIGQRYWFCD